jgi:hypothetical protein
MGRAVDRRQLAAETGPRPLSLPVFSPHGLGRLGHGRQLDPIDPRADELAAGSSSAGRRQQLGRRAFGHARIDRPPAERAWKGPRPAARRPARGRRRSAGSSARGPGGQLAAGRGRLGAARPKAPRGGPAAGRSRAGGITKIFFYFLPKAQKSLTLRSYRSFRHTKKSRADVNLKP